MKYKTALPQLRETVRSDEDEVTYFEDNNQLEDKTIDLRFGL